MLTASGSFATMVQGVSQIVDDLVTINLPAGLADVSLTAESVHITAATVTDMPAGTRIQTGYPSIGCDITLSGKVTVGGVTLSAADYFSPYNTASPLYRQSVLGCAVTVSVGLFPLGTSTSELLQKFTGTVDTCTVDPAAGTVALTCIDKRSMLRSIADLPAVVTAPPYNAGLTSEFALDALLRAATKAAISSWPAQRAQCLLAAGMRASLWPEVGTLYAIGGAQPIPTFAPGVNGSALAAPAPVLGGLTNVSYFTTTPIGTSVYVEFFVQGAFFPISVGINDSSSFGLGVPLLACYATNTSLNVVPSGGLGGSSFAWTTAVGTGPRCIGFLLTLPAAGGTSWSVTAYLDGVAQSSGALSFASARNSNDWNIITVSPQTGTIEAVQVTSETAPTPNNAFVPTAVLDPSLNTLQVVPEISGDPWQVIQQIADAEQAVAGFDESGVFRFRNRKTIRSSAVSRSITSSASLKSLQIESDSASNANHVVVPYTSWVFGSATAVYTLDALWVVPHNSTRTWTVMTDTLVAALDTVGAVLPNTHTTTDGASWYRASTTSAGLTTHPGLTMTVQQPSSGTVKITLTNATGVSAYLVSSADFTDVAVGTPSLWVGGVPVTSAGEVTVDLQYPDLANGGAVSGPYGDVAVTLSSNPWIQDDGSARQLGQDLLIDMYSKRPNLQSVEIIPDARLQLTDRVRIQDPDLSGVDEYATLWGWELVLSATEWSMSIDARTVTFPGGWILGVAGRSELGVTTYT